MKWAKLVLAVALILGAGVNLYRKIDRLFAEDHWLPEQKSDPTPVRSTLGAGALLVAAGMVGFGLTRSAMRTHFEPGNRT